MTVVFLLLAEYECLDAVAAGDAARGDFDIVVGALAAAGVGLALPIVLGPEDDWDRDEPAEAGAESVSWKGLIALGVLLLLGRRQGK